MTYLIDTDVWVDFFKHKPAAKALIVKLSQMATLTLSALTITELRTGWTSQEAAFLLPRLYALATVVPVTKEIAEQAGALAAAIQGQRDHPWHTGYRDRCNRLPQSRVSGHQQHQRLPHGRSNAA
jgi:predicted nucleic acid-binding protein